MQQKVRNNKDYIATQNNKDENVHSYTVGKSQIQRKRERQRERRRQREKRERKSDLEKETKKLKKYDTQ